MQKGYFTQQIIISTIAIRKIKEKTNKIFNTASKLLWIVVGGLLR